MPTHTESEIRKNVRRNVRRIGTKRFPRGRLVQFRDKSRGVLRGVVVGTLKEGRSTDIAVNTGASQRTKVVDQQDIFPITIARSVAGLKGRGSIKPKVKGKITLPKIRALKVMTQRTLDRAGG